jgi:hypothetical protein
VTDDSDFELSFTIEPDTVSLRPIGEFRVLNIEGPVVLVGDAAYRSEDLRELDVSDVRSALNALSDDSNFQTIVNNCPTNTPLVYDDIDYLTRHLPTNALEKCDELSQKKPFSKELILLVAYVERQNSLIGHSDNVLEYYLDQRKEIATKLESTAEVDGEIERSFFSYLLLASALIEELTTETVLNEFFREEARLDTTSELVRSMGHAKRLEKLCDIQILSGGGHSELVEVKERRNNLVHDAQKRAGLDELESRREVAQVLEKTDRCAAVLLSISGKDIESTVARKGTVVYVNQAQREAVEDTITIWERERKRELRVLWRCRRVTLEDLRWDVGSSTTEQYDVTEGFDFDGFEDEGIYQVLMAFLRDASDAFLDRIDADANESNLDRFDFALLTLLCAGHSYEDIARWLDTDPKYVQRKENVIAWRASEFEKSRVGTIPRPKEPVWSNADATPNLF